ncbi:MAG: hypothetical protein IT547_07985 [Hyphomonadaceae bacterium]|nr:hypothetical protein [Hyphomonadaceae bacterium]
MSRRAIALIWERMVELAESANDEVVSGQRSADAASAQRIADVAGDLHTLAQAIVILTCEDGNA